MYGTPAHTPRGSTTQEYPATSHLQLLSWVEKIRKLCRPSKIHWCDGSQQEYDTLCQELVDNKTFVKLNPVTRPNCFLARTDERDTYRPDSAAFVCCKSKEDAGPSNTWVAPDEMRAKLTSLFSGCMEGRTMYIVPFSMGPIGSPYSRIGVEITDSVYTVVNMRIVTRMGTLALKQLRDKMPFTALVHSVGCPLKEGEADVPWACNPDKLVVAHFTEENSVWSFGSQFGGNAMLSKRSVGLRLASAWGQHNKSTLTAHCSVLSLTSPEGKKYFVAAGFPSGTGKTNISITVPTIPGWTQRCVSEEISWMCLGDDDRLYAVNPENGFFGVAAGMNDFTNRPIMDAMSSNTIFTNVAMTEDGDIWWEGMTKDTPARLIDWTGQEWTPGCGRKAAHPNSRYSIPANQCPILDPEWDNPNGVPIHAFVFAHRRRDTIPLVTEAFSWQHGIFMASTISLGDMIARDKFVPAHRDSLSMIPFCGCNINDYLAKWLEYRQYLGYQSPKIFTVNWFLESDKPASQPAHPSGRPTLERRSSSSALGSNYIWPGFGENSRVLKWICERIDGTGLATRTPIGYVPAQRGLDTAGMNISPDRVLKLLKVDAEAWLKEVSSIRQFFDTLGPKLPNDLTRQLDQLEKRLHVHEDQPPTHNKALLAHVDSMINLCKPANIRWCTGHTSEYDEMCSLLVATGTFTPLNPKLRPNSYLARSDPRDVARVESKTFICCDDKEDAGPTNNWCDPAEMKARLNKLFDGCMEGRTMYVIPFCMGPLGSPYAKYGVEITDSPYVVVNMHIMVRMGNKVLTALGDQSFLPCLHSVGKPLKPGDKDVAWPCDPENTVIAHFPQEPSVMSFGSGYGGNALLGKKCFALRIASTMGRKQGWLAEHMLILGITSPQGKKTYIGAAFPSACGKTNLAMLVPTLPGWTVRCVGDDIAWLHTGEDGVLRGINPESGFFGVAPGTSEHSNASAMRTLQKNTLFTNVALTEDGDVWWEGMTKTPPEGKIIDWTGQDWAPGCGRLAAHPNSRYTTPAAQCPVIDPEWENPNGVPISAIVFGGRRNSLVPLVTEAFSWPNGVFMGSIISSEQTAAAEGKLGVVRRDPFAMLPFCGYNMADYFKHWMDYRNFTGYNSPKIFYVNWFRKNKEGKFIWPGFGENSRVLKWITERIGRNPTGKSVRTAIGHIPAPGAIDLSGLDDVTAEDMEQLLQVDTREWKAEIDSIRQFYASFGPRLPESIAVELKEMEKRLKLAEVPAPTTNKKLLAWVEQVRTLTKPFKVHWCTGTDQEYDEMCSQLVSSGTFIKLNEKLRPNSYLARSDPRDVARVESKTFICSGSLEDAGPTNNWCDPVEMKARLNKLFEGCMEGRTMYVIPFLMGPVGSPYSKYGVEISDSPYVVVNMKIMTRIGTRILNTLTEDQFFLPCLHSVGKPLKPGDKDVSWPCNPENTVIAHFPEEPSVMSFGSGYGGNALLGKKCYSLRIASVLGRKEGWLAEHMLILGMTSPEGKKYYIGAAFPSACGKTNLAMLVPTLPGWTVRCVGDDIAWLHMGENGRLLGINPENGFFGVAPGTNAQSNASAMATISKNSIFTNVALTEEGDVWWEGMTKAPPAKLVDWTGQAWSPDCGRKAAHPNSRYTTPATQCPVIDPEWENPNGVPICAVLFGGRRERLVPLVTEAFIWEQGVFMASTISSEQTAAAEGKQGEIRRDPFAMLPFCGYNMADYWAHWVDFRKTLGYLSPKIFYVNWFRKEKGQFLWPGFGENSRVLKWVCERVDGTGKARSTPIGYVPTNDALDIGGLDISRDTMHKLTHVDHQAWLQEIPSIRAYYAQFGDKLPSTLSKILDDLEGRLLTATAAPTNNKNLLQFVKRAESMCQPKNVVWCTGTDEEYDELCDQLVEQGTFYRLNEALRPKSFLARTSDLDNSKEMHNNFLCTQEKEEAGVGSNWRDPKEMREHLDSLFSGCMRGRTMYVIPFSMGPIGSPYSILGCQITDSPYVVVSMRLLTRMGTTVLNAMTNPAHTFMPVMHSMGYPLQDSNGATIPDVTWPCNPDKRVIAQFPEQLESWSFGSNFGSNVLPVRIACGLKLSSIVAHKQGWLAERMAIMQVTSPDGAKAYMAIAAPEGCGKTNLSMLVPTIPGWTTRVVSDDIAWLHIRPEDSKLVAINPEAGFFDGAISKSYLSCRSAMATLRRNSIFVNVALTADGDVWWEGLSPEAPADLVDWQGKAWNPTTAKTPAAHPNARYTAPCSQCPVIDPDWENPNGVPISAIIFSNRRKSVLPWVCEAPTWERGVLYGASISTERSASSAAVSAAIASGAPVSGTNPKITREPFAIFPYLGYNVCDYFQNWLDIRKAMGYNIPKIFTVNWFRESTDGRLLWPGFDENSRFIKWIFQRIFNGGQAVKTALGFIPPISGLDLRGLDIEIEDVFEGLQVNDDVLAEVDDVTAYFKSFPTPVPNVFFQELEAIRQEIQKK